MIEKAARALFDGWRRRSCAALVGDPDAQAQVTRLLTRAVFADRGSLL